jgi:nicotinate-nucleotide adenylyltransferase
MRIGLFGGSFNPIHIGHILLARQLRQLSGLDEVWMMVSPQNPLKRNATDLLNDRLRYGLVSIALHGEKGLRACDYELNLPKPSYTWNTLQHLRRDYAQHTFTLLIGGDNWQMFPQWSHASDILENYNVVVYPRRGSRIGTETLPERVTVVRTELIDISSTEIRRRVEAGGDIGGMVPAIIEPLVYRCYQKP